MEFLFFHFFSGWACAPCGAGFHKGGAGDGPCVALPGLRDTATLALGTSSRLAPPPHLGAAEDEFAPYLRASRARRCAHADAGAQGTLAANASAAAGCLGAACDSALALSPGAVCYVSSRQPGKLFAVPDGAGGAAQVESRLCAPANPDAEQALRLR